MEFVIARNPDDGSSLPFLVRLPLGQQGVVLKVRDTWPRTAKVYCHRAEGWPEEPDIVERVPVVTLRTPHNMAYLRTKQKKLGHMLDFD